MCRIGILGRRREGGVSTHSSARHLKSSCTCYAIEILTEAHIRSDMGGRESPLAVLEAEGRK